MPENTFPTIQDYRDLLNDLVEKGFGDHPAQLLVVPDSTLQALVRHEHPGDQTPATMIEWQVSEARQAAGLISADRLAGRGISTSQN